MSRVFTVELPHELEILRGKPVAARELSLEVACEIRHDRLAPAQFGLLVVNGRAHVPVQAKQLVVDRTQGQQLALSDLCFQPSQEIGVAGELQVIHWRLFR
jgi:hypothetical protein